ncbi:glycolipid transfer protein domain-containing protein 2 [Crotalus tigris]|uniref:glycolipid transfer protein domain-containing protein 2 n=1 Tax=Crotalus tigris TaxID=88082 RepID=UPI00192F6B99|nr:glycolipid transfer protein domain-containing protein 2 [Crotalus tigris]
MGALAGVPLRPCQLLLPLGVFLLLLYLSGWHLPKGSLAACVQGGHRCPWLGETLPKEEEEEEEEPGPAPAPAPAWTPTPPLPLQGEEFDIRHLQSAFSASLSPRGEVLLQEYLQGWRQLLKFLDMLGRAFGLISREVESKISILQQHQEGPHGLHYRTVQSMVDFELASGLVGFQSLSAHQPPSGCRTLLRLHRALKWLELFLHKLGTSQKDEKSSRMCAEAYQVALAPYHSWWVQQAVALAFLAMPSRQELYHIIAWEKPATGAVVLTTVESLGRVYNVTQEVYSAHGMLELP